MKHVETSRQPKHVAIQFHISRELTNAIITQQSHNTYRRIAHGDHLRIANTWKLHHYALTSSHYMTNLFVLNRVLKRSDITVSTTANICKTSILLSQTYPTGGSCPSTTAREILPHLLSFVVSLYESHTSHAII